VTQNGGKQNSVYNQRGQVSVLSAYTNICLREENQCNFQTHSDSKVIYTKNRRCISKEQKAFPNRKADYE
jgi:hypothetical protein